LRIRHEAFDLPAGKTRDASDRLLPPETKIACTRTSHVPGVRFRGFHRVGASQSLGSARLDRGTERFTTPETASADRKGREPFGFEERGGVSAFVPCVGVVFPRRLRDRASDIPVASPSSSRGASRLREVLGEGRSRQDHRDLRPVTGASSCDPGCLPSVWTLRRIRWPLQPRSRDRRAAFGERDARWMTLSRHPEPSPIRDRFTPAAVDSRCPFARCGCRRRRRPSPRARPPFTPAATLFGALRASLFEARHRLPTSATCSTTCGHFDPNSRSSQGRRPQPPSFSDASRGFFLGSGDTRRAAHRPSNQTSVPVPPACAGLPDRDTWMSAPPQTACAAGVVWRMT